jgi:hypothetical protein
MFKVAGLANLYPTKIKIVASVANGILLRITGITNTLIKNPCMIGHFGFLHQLHY